LEMKAKVSSEKRFVVEDFWARWTHERRWLVFRMFNHVVEFQFEFIDEDVIVGRVTYRAAVNLSKILV
jgi:hypothetical protein